MQRSENQTKLDLTLADHLRAEERSMEGDPLAIKHRNDRVGRAFLKFHREHPEVYARLVAVVRRYRDAGVKRGIGYFFEAMRHEHVMSGRDAQGFKLNNNFRSRYARLIESEHPDLAGFFRKRALTALGARASEPVEGK